MPVSLRVPREKEELIKKAAAKAGMSKSAYILEAIDEKLGIVKDREQAIREVAGWLSHEEAEELRQATSVFEEIHEGDWP
jgi:predicted DNA-binding protein